MPKKESVFMARRPEDPALGSETSTTVMLRARAHPGDVCYSITHLRTASLTSLAISSLACFFALSVIPTSLSSERGDVLRGSNSMRWPSFVGIDTRAELDGVGPNGTGAPFGGGGAVSGESNCVREWVRVG